MIRTHLCCLVDRHDGRLRGPADRIRPRRSHIGHDGTAPATFDRQPEDPADVAEAGPADRGDRLRRQPGDGQVASRWTSGGRYVLEQAVALYAATRRRRSPTSGCRLVALSVPNRDDYARGDFRNMDELAVCDTDPRDGPDGGLDGRAGRAGRVAGRAGPLTARTGGRDREVAHDEQRDERYGIRGGRTPSAAAAAGRGSAVRGRSGDGRDRDFAGQSLKVRSTWPSWPRRACGPSSGRRSSRPSRRRWPTPATSTCSTATSARPPAHPPTSRRGWTASKPPCRTS